MFLRFLALFFALLAGPVLADSPSPTPSTTPAAPARPAAAPVLPANFDPCGGPQELLNKFGTTPCVVPAGEAMFSAGYTSAKVNGNVEVGSIATLPISALARAYPQAVLTVGVTPRTDIELAFPSYLQVNGAANGLLASGDEDTSFAVKQRLAFNPMAATITSLEAEANFPTGSPNVRDAWPAYSLELLQSKAWPLQRLALIGALRLTDGPTIGPMPVHQTSGSATALGLWTSPGNFLASAGVQVSTPSGTVAPIVSIEQLISRHVGVQVFYAGMGTGIAGTIQTGLPFALRTTGTVNVVGGNLIFLAGRSGP